MLLKNKLLLSFLCFLLWAPASFAATTLCLEWEVPQGEVAPDFDIALVLGRDRVLHPQQTPLKIGSNIVAIHEKTNPTDEECITLIDEAALKNHSVGIHHYGKDATQLRFLELFERNQDGTTKVVGNYKNNFVNNTDGDRNATPRSGSEYWVLIPVPEVLEILNPAATVAQNTTVAATTTVPPTTAAPTTTVPVAAAPDCEPGAGKDLRHCNFTDKNLGGANFERANISGVSFKRAMLKNAKFNDADCHKTDFSHAKLEDASFTRAKCSQADFTKTDAREVNFKDANLTKSNFRKADIRKANFKRATLRKSNIKEANRDEGANFEDIRE